MYNNVCGCSAIIINIYETIMNVSKTQIKIPLMSGNNNIFVFFFFWKYRSSIFFKLSKANIYAWI